MKQFTYQLSLQKKILVFGAFLALGIIILSLFLYYPLLQSAGNSHGYSCSRSHIYLPTRLDFKGCKTVTGTIVRVKAEQDGDTHAQLRLNKQFSNLLTSQNYQRQGGNLVIENTCHGSPQKTIEILANFACRNYKSKLPDPTVGKTYEVTGNYVIDDWHGSWAEIHGLSELKQLN